MTIKQCHFYIINALKIYKKACFYCDNKKNRKGPMFANRCKECIEIYLTNLIENLMDKNKEYKNYVLEKDNKYTNYLQKIATRIFTNENDI